MMSGLLENMVQIYVISLGLGFLSSLFMCLAINADAKARNLKSRKLYAVLAFFCPFIVGIVYACTRNSANKLDTSPVENPKSLVKKSITFFVIAMVIYVGAFGYGIYMGATGAMDALGSFENVVTYDMKGNLIGDDEYMPAYDKDGNKYVLVESDIDAEEYFSYYEREDTKEQFDSMYCYLDEDGYFYFDKDDKIQINDDGDFIGENGKKFYSINSTYWDENGEMKDYWSSIVE